MQVNEMRQHKYALIATRIREEIQTGEYHPGDRLPTEFDLTKRFQVSRQTVRQAMAQLQKEGYLIQRQGSGTYVTEFGREKKNTRRTMTIGVLSSYISNYIFPSIIRGIEQELSVSGYSMRLAATENRVDNEYTLLQRYLDNPVDGLIVEGTKTTLPNPNIALYRELSRQGTPLVFLHASYPELKNEVLVGMDDFEGGRLAVEYLAGKGHVRIAGIFKSDDRQGLERYAGFNEGLHQAGLPINDRWVRWFTTEDRDQSEYFKSGAWVSEFLGDATAVVCYNDMTAVWLGRLLEAQGRRVPEDILLVSFDQSSYYEMSGLRLVSFAHQKEELGRVAAKKMLRLIHGEAQESVRLAWGRPKFLP